MDNNELSQKWPALKIQLMTQYPELTDDDFTTELGKESEQLLRIQEKLKKNKKDTDNFLSIMG